MTRSIGVYGVLLVVLLGLSWDQWTAPPKVDYGDKIVLLDGEKGDLEKVVWKGEKDEAVLEPKKDGSGDYVWVTYTKWEEPKVPKVDPAAPATPPATPAADGTTPPATDVPAAPATPAMPAAPEKVAKVDQFKAGDAGDKLLDSLSPLLALRRLDDVSADKIPTLGLDAPKESLEIVRKGHVHDYEVGGEAYGSKDRYVRDKETGAIFLVDDETLRPLKYARTRLPDRALFSFPREKISEAILSSGPGSVDMAQKNPDDKDKATWVKASAPDAAGDQYKTWMDKALALKSTAYTSAEDTPANLEPRFRLTLKSADGKEETLEVSQAGTDGDWYAKSEYTRGLVKLLKGPTSGLAEDVTDLVTK